MKRFVVVAEGRDVDGASVEPRHPIDTTVNGVKLKGYRLDEFDLKEDAEMYAVIARKNGYLYVKALDTQPSTK